MSTCSSQIALLLVVLLVGKHGISSIPACIIIDTNMVQEAEGDSASSNNRSSSSILLRNLRMLDHQRSSDLTKFLVEPIPISHVDLQETSSPVSISFNLSSLKKSLAEPVVERTFSPCSLELLNEIETQMVVPFEFRRLRMEQPDHQTKFLDDDPRESVPDLSTAVYERRSDPEGLRFCRICRDGRPHATQHASTKRSLSLSLLTLFRSLDSTDRMRNCALRCGTITGQSPAGYGMGRDQTVGRRCTLHTCHCLRHLRLRLRTSLQTLRIERAMESVCTA